MRNAFLRKALAQLLSLSHLLKLLLLLLIRKEVGRMLEGLGTRLPRMHHIRRVLEHLAGKAE